MRRPVGTLPGLLPGNHVGRTAAGLGEFAQQLMAGQQGGQLVRRVHCGLGVAGSARRPCLQRARPATSARAASRRSNCAGRPKACGWQPAVAISPRWRACPRRRYSSGGSPRIRASWDAEINGIRAIIASSSRSRLAGTEEIGAGALFILQSIPARPPKPTQVRLYRVHRACWPCCLPPVQLPAADSAVQVAPRSCLACPAGCRCGWT